MYDAFFQPAKRWDAYRVKGDAGINHPALQHSGQPGTGRESA